ncbi:MAG: hypothetical protein ACI8RD_012217 [Bacillariaceae sp.]|jgi:hypothetical protein
MNIFKNTQTERNEKIAILGTYIHIPYSRFHSVSNLLNIIKFTDTNCCMHQHIRLLTST